MPSGHCPDCGERHPITPTGESIPGKEASRYWQLAVHDRKATEEEWRDAGCPAVEFVVRCEGSGKKI